MSFLTFHTKTKYLLNKIRNPLTKYKRGKEVNEEQFKKIDFFFKFFLNSLLFHHFSSNDNLLFIDAQKNSTAIPLILADIRAIWVKVSCKCRGQRFSATLYSNFTVNH